MMYKSNSNVEKCIKTFQISELKPVAIYILRLGMPNLSSWNLYLFKNRLTQII